LKQKTKTPKYGLLYNTSFIGRAIGKNKGKISRYLANKCAMAARLDNFLVSVIIILSSPLIDSEKNSRNKSKEDFQEQEKTKRKLRKINNLWTKLWVN
jgi:RNA processing factor Prp31